MKKQQHRWASEDEILEAINHCHALSNELLKEASELETGANVAMAEATKIDAALESLTETQRVDAELKINAFVLSAKEKRERARKNYKRATRLLEIKAPKLGHILAAFRTVPMMPITGKDVAVVG